MRSIVNLFFLFLCCRLVATTSLFENGVSPKPNYFQKIYVNSPRLPNSARSSLHISDNRNYHPNVHNYQSSPKYNSPNYYNNYRPPNLPHFPKVPRSHHAKYPSPLPYNVLNSYTSAPFIGPMKHLPTDKQKHVLNEVKPVYPTRNIKFEEKPQEKLVENLSVKYSDELPSFDFKPEAKINRDPFIDFEGDTISDSFDQLTKNMTNPLDEITSSGNIETITHFTDDFILNKINETKQNDNATEEIKIQKDIDEVPTTIEDNTGNILVRSTILTNDTYIAPLNFEQERLVDEVHLPLETTKESDNNTNSFIEGFHNETSNQFKENKDFPVNLLPTENPPEIEKNYDLLTDKDLNDPNSARSLASNNTEDNYGTKFSDLNISSTPTVNDISTASVATPLLENGLSPKLQGFQNYSPNNARLPNLAHNSFHIPDNRRYHTNVRNYQSSPKHNVPNYYNSYWPSNLPHFRQVPKSHHPQYPSPPPYNVLSSYNSAPFIRPMKHLPTDIQKHVLNDVKPVYPTGNIKLEEKLQERLVAPSLEFRNIISKPIIRDHYMSHPKNYMIISPKGTVDDVDYLKPAVTDHQNNVLVNGADITPIENGSPAQIFEHESYTSSNFKSAPVLQLDLPVNQQELSKSTVQVIVERQVDNKFQNNRDFVIDTPSKVSDSNTLINNTPTTIIEIDPHFITSSDNNLTKTQTEEGVNTSSADKDIRRSDLFEENSKEPVSPDPSIKSSDELPSFDFEPEAKISFDPFIDFENDKISDPFHQIRSNMAKPLDDNASSENIETIARFADDFRDLFVSSQINETKEIENTTEAIYLNKNQFIDKVSTTEDNSSGTLHRLTILANDTNIAALNSEQVHLFDNVHLPLETYKESTFHVSASSSINSFHNETSDQFRESKDIPVNLLATENPTKNVENYNLLTDKQLGDSNSITSVSGSDTSNNLSKNLDVNISSTPTVEDISPATDDITPMTTQERSVYFKIDKGFWEKLKHKEIPFDVVYFYQVQEPVVKKGVKAVTYPNGTVVTYETVHEVEEGNRHK